MSRRSDGGGGRVSHDRLQGVAIDDDQFCVRRVLIDVADQGDACDVDDLHRGSLPRPRFNGEFQSNQGHV